MSDTGPGGPGPPPRDAAVFATLDAFDDAPVDPDAMDRMLLNLAAASDPPDWQLDALTPDALTPDFYAPSSAYHSLPLHYIDPHPVANSPAHSPTQSSAVPLQPPALAAPAVALPPLPPSVPSPMPVPTTAPTTGPIPPTPAPVNHTTSPAVSPSFHNQVHVALDGRPIISTSHQQPARTPTKSPMRRSHPSQSARKPQPSSKSSDRASSRTPPLHSPAPSKQRVPTALCTLCGKSISTNGANFRRHEAACRRQRAADRLPASNPSRQSPSVAIPTPQLPVSLPIPAASASHNDRMTFDVAEPVAASLEATPLSRRDSDLLNVVRRLETSIGTLDVSARLCLRDALLSLSSKASNPQVPPTPEQEAMNRAAEYLVLRMLFLSGQQVMHTAPGTAGPQYGAAVTSASTSVPTSSPRSHHTTRDSSMGGTANGEADDGTVAASTGTGDTANAKGENALAENSGQALSDSKVEDKAADGT